MRPIIIVMLAVQALLILVTIATVLTAKPRPERTRPIWSSLAIALIISATASFQIADHHPGADGSELLQYGSGMLFGMGLLSLLVLMRQRLGIDARS
jgi:tellurite resistance protein TehA-like permease